MNLPEKLQLFLNKNNFEVIGKGNYSTIYSKNNINYVLKINNIRKDDNLSKFVDFCNNNEDEHLPKFSNIMEYENTSFVFMEKLKNFDPNILNKNINSMDIKHFFQSIITDFKKSKTYKKQLKEFEKNWQYFKISSDEFIEEQFFYMSEILYELVEEKNIKINLIDVTFDNIMIRNNNTIVLSDVIG